VLSDGYSRTRLCVVVFDLFKFAGLAILEVVEEDSIIGDSTHCALLREGAHFSGAGAFVGSS
jgi:hypothetical protein